jgi:hypothetical protein
LAAAYSAWPGLAEAAGGAADEGERGAVAVRARAAAGQRVEEGARGPGGAQQVHVDGLADALDGRLVQAQLLRRPRAGVGHGDVEAPEARHGLPGRGGQSLRVAHVGLQHQRALAPALRRRRARAARRGACAPSSARPAALVGEGLRQRAPDAAGRAVTSATLP